MRLSTVLCVLLPISALACVSSNDTPSSATSLFGVGTSPTIVFEQRVTLTAVGSDEDATGFADLVVRGREGNVSGQRLHLQVRRLAGAASFALVADGTQLATFTTTPGGTFEAIYETNPKGSHQLLPTSLDLEDAHLIEIRDASGAVVLTGAVEQPTPDDGCEFALTPTGADPDAAGEVEIEVETEDGATEQSLELNVENLASSTSFKLFVDGGEIASFTTDANGRAKVVFSSNPDSDELPLPANLPNVSLVKLVEIRSADGAVVLVGSNPC